MSLNLGVILQASAAARPDHPVLKLGEMAMTYAELDRAARGIAGSLRARGLRPGEHVAVMIPNVPQFPMAYFGALYAGLTVVPLNVLLSAEEVTYHLQDSDARLLVAHPMFAAAAKPGAAGAGVDVVWADGEEGPTLAELAQGEPVDGVYPTGADDTAVILYTSGTTGRPKGAELTHSNLFVNCVNVMPRLIPVAADEVALATLPLFHSFGQTCIQNAMIAVGGTFVLLPRFTPDDALGLMEAHGVTLFAGVPTMYFAMLNQASREYDLSKLRWCVTGGAAMPVEVMRAFEEKYGVQILEGFGLSETSPVASFNTLDRPRKPGSIGYPVWGVEMAIVDDNDRPLPDGERGEIVIRGHNIMKGYYKRPDATAEAINEAGWFHSGDIGVRDADGSYAIVDRKKDMILRGGYNVYPREVEEVLYAHPAVAEAAVIGVPHESLGEEVKAVVALKAGQQLSEQEVIDYCKQHVAAYKYPRSVEFVESLPKGPTGKILKRELR